MPSVCQTPCRTLPTWQGLPPDFSSGWICAVLELERQTGAHSVTNRNTRRITSQGGSTKDTMILELE